MKRSDDKNNSDKLSRSQKINIKVEKEREHNPYYLKVSKRYRTLKFASLALLLVYLIAMLVMYRSSITYENLVYLMKDLDTDIDATGAVFKEVKYDESSKMSAGLYKGSLAVATTTSFTLYNTTGTAEREYSISMENPKVLTGEKYVMVYDVGGSSYSVYTAIVDVLTKQTDYTLQGAALSDSGAFALISRARENRYMVSFFDENFKEVSRIYKDRYVMDAALSADGENYAVVSCDVEGSDITTEVMSGRCDSESAVTSTISGAMPLKVGFFSDGSFCVVCDDAVSFFSKDGASVSEHRLNGYGVSGVSFSKERVMIVESDNIVESRSTVTVYDHKGEVVLTREETKVASSALGEGAAYLAYDGQLTRVSFDGAVRRAECSLSVSSLIPFSDNVLVLGPTSAVTGFAPQETAESGSSEDTSAPGVDADFEPIS